MKLLLVSLLGAYLVGCTTVPPVPTTPITQIPPTVIAKRLPKIGLALGGGAARGFAHIGVIQVLEEAGIMSRSINIFELKEADIAVRPALAGVASADFASKRRSIEAGRAAMLAALPQLRTAIAVKSR